MFEIPTDGGMDVHDIEALFHAANMVVRPLRKGSTGLEGEWALLTSTGSELAAQYDARLYRLDIEGTAQDRAAVGRLAPLFLRAVRRVSGAGIEGWALRPIRFDRRTTRSTKERNAELRTSEREARGRSDREEERNWTHFGRIAPGLPCGSPCPRPELPPRSNPPPTARPQFRPHSPVPIVRPPTVPPIRTPPVVLSARPRVMLSPRPHPPAVQLGWAASKPLPGPDDPERR